MSANRNEFAGRGQHAPPCDLRRLEEQNVAETSSSPRAEPLNEAKHQKVKCGDEDIPATSNLKMLLPFVRAQTANTGSPNSSL